MKALFKNGCTQFWFNAQKMEIQERKKTIKYIIKLSATNCGFIEYSAKFFMASLIDYSECYFNGLGYSTRVKEFDDLGWYDENNKLNFEKVMNCF
jgi:hypothetical protein